MKNKIPACDMAFILNLSGSMAPLTEAAIRGCIKPPCLEFPMNLPLGPDGACRKIKSATMDLKSFGKKRFPLSRMPKILQIYRFENEKFQPKSNDAAGLQ